MKKLDSSPLEHISFEYSASKRDIQEGFVGLDQSSILNSDYHGKKTIIQGDDEVNRTQKGDEEAGRMA
jgi:hypothetical protein